MSSVESTLFYIGTVAPAARAILAATALLGVAGVVTALAWRASASVRHATWLLALAAAIAVGVAARVPSVEITSNTVINGPGVVFDRTFIDPQLPVALPRVGAPDLTPLSSTIVEATQAMLAELKKTGYWKVAMPSTSTADPSTSTTKSVGSAIGMMPP